MRKQPMTVWLWLAVTCGTLVAVSAYEPGPQAQKGDALFVTGATLIDGTGRPAVPDAAFVVENGRIARVGRADDISAPAGTKTVDASGHFIVPGLIDSHVHYRDWLGELLLAHGVTSAFDLGDPSDWIFAVREALARGLMRGPRLYVSGNIIDGRGEQPRASMGGRAGSGRDRANRTLVSSPQEAREATRALVARGADFIKVYQELTDEELAAVADEAHRAGLVVFGHTYHADRATAAGLDVITHLWGIASSCMSPDVLDRYHAGDVPSPYPYLRPPRRGPIVRELAERRSIVNPLLINEHAGVNPHTAEFHADTARLMSRSELRYVPNDAKLGLLLMFTKVRNYASRYGLFPPVDVLPSEVQEQFREGYGRASEFVRDFVAAGGRIVAGSDSAGASMTPGLSLHHELRLLVDAGLTPMQAIESATRIPGQLVAKRDAVGTLEPGRRADFLILDADPLADIRNLRRIVSVYKDGSPVDPDYHADYGSPIPYPIVEFSSSYVPAPIISGIEPMSALAGSDPIRLTVRGSGFSILSVVTASGRALATQFVDPSRLETTLPAHLLTAIDTLPISVENPRPGGGTSNAYGFVVSPVPIARRGPSGAKTSSS